MDTITAVVRQGHITAAIIEHDMDVVCPYSDRGGIIFEGPPQAVFDNEEVMQTIRG